MSGRFDESRDHPLSCNWRLIDPDVLQVLGLPLAKSRAAVGARGQIIAEAFVVGRADPHAWISYSRRRAFYAERIRYWPRTYTYDNVVYVVDQLAASGLLNQEKAAPGHLGWQSRFKASSALINELSRATIAILHDPHELVLLRDSDGQLIDYRESDLTKRWRRNLATINEALCAATLELQGRSIRAGDPLRAGLVNLGAVHSDLHRVFNRGCFNLGGRLYGGWWQNIPKEFRADITINGSPTIELDFPRLHPTLLYGEAGQQLHGDPYEIFGWDRTRVKIAFNTLVNADTRSAAVKSIARDIGGVGAYGKADHLVRQIEAKHQSIAPAFGTGAGLRLMRRDSDMTEHIMRRLLRQGVIALPIHDSFIVSHTTKNKGELMEAMAAALHKATANNRESRTGFTKSIPQYGASSLVLCVFVFFPDLPQRDLFGADRMAIPASDVLDWQGGVVPTGVKQALRHEACRRGLRQVDLARHVALSRSQMANLQSGRSGASPEAAARIRDFLIAGAKTVGGPP
jgi:hypothetical protein